MNVLKSKKLIVDDLTLKKKKFIRYTLVDDLGADSLDAVELIMAVEDEFDIELMMKLLKHENCL